MGSFHSTVSGRVSFFGYIGGERGTYIIVGEVGTFCG